MMNSFGSLMFSYRFLPALAAVALAAVCAEAGEPRPWQPHAQGAVDPSAVVVEDGRPDLRWVPRDFQFVAGDEVRHIDYETGEDANPGTKAAPWKHHPWDANWTGADDADAGVDTYVFKGGVVYRGSIEVRRSGTADQPIRLTRDPDWGEGRAILSGAERVTGWRGFDPQAARFAPESADHRLAMVVAAVALAADAGDDLLPPLRGKDGGIPVGWELFKPWMRSHVQIKTEDGRKFIRMTGRAILHYFHDVPAGAKTLTLRGSTRVADYKQGKQPWDDMRVGLAYLDAEGEPIGKPWQNDVIHRADQDWQAFTQAHPVPAGAVKLKLYVSHKAGAGKFDVTELTLTAGEPKDAPKAAAEAEDKPGGEGGASAAQSQGPPSRTGFPNRAEAPDLPAAALAFAESVRDRLVVADLPAGVEPRFLWAADAAADPPLTVAREPDWTIDDKYHWDEHWHHWDKTERDGLYITAYDPEHLKDADPHAYLGATVWADVPNQNFQISTPAPHPAVQYDPEQGSLRFKVRHPKKHPRANSPYYLTNLPRFLDEPGEWFARDGRVYFLPPEGADPEAMGIEAASRKVLIDIGDHRHIEISGLTFQHANTADPNRAAYAGGPDRPWLSFEIGAIQLRGNVEHVTIAHNTFRQTPAAVVGFPLRDGDRMDRLAITDNRMEELGDGGVELTNGIIWKQGPIGSIGRVDVLRNRMSDIGLGMAVGDILRGVVIRGVEQVHVAGNVIDHVAGPGIDIWNGRLGSGRDTQIDKQPPSPLVRGLIHHNKVTDSLLRITDYGGIESWGGSAYVFNNLSARALGYVPTSGWYHKAELFYFDHQYKGFFFNNVGWGIAYERGWDNTMTSSFFKQAHGFLCYAFHNTGSTVRTTFNAGVTQAHARNRFIANLALRPVNAVFYHAGTRREPEFTTIAYTRNLIAGDPEEIYGRYPNDGETFTLERFRGFLQERPAMVGDVGRVVETMPVLDVEAQRFEPTADSPAIDGGAKVFVPWQLYKTIGEWHFHAHPADPTTVVGENFWQTKQHQMAQQYDQHPRGDLKLTAATLDDYEQGTLEDWTDSALRFDGRRYAQQVDGADFEGTSLDMGAHGFVIEAVFRAGQPGGVIAEKLLSGCGYRLSLDERGRLVLDLHAGEAQAALIAEANLADQRWHHVLAEVDRAGGEARLYLDGKPAKAATIEALGDRSLSNAGTFVAGRGLVGAMDFLRLAAGTLADADTTFEELYAWQFDGPFLRDIAGHAADGAARDVGALEAGRP